MTICPDDDLDLTELTEKLEKFVNNLFEGQDIDISIACIISVCLNSIRFQCDSREKFIRYQEIINALMNDMLSRPNMI